MFQMQRIFRNLGMKADLCYREKTQMIHDILYMLQIAN